MLRPSGGGVIMRKFLGGGGFMNTLFTAYPQLDNIITALLVVYAIIAPIAMVLYCKKLILQDFPGKRTINDLRIEISDFSGMVADLTERFNRFQKRQGMRQAREDKAAEESVLQQAQRIAAESEAEKPTTDKLDLYRKARH